jgi:hypothetical protein
MSIDNSTVVCAVLRNESTDRDTMIGSLYNFDLKFVSNGWSKFLIIKK